MSRATYLALRVLTASLALGCDPAPADDGGEGDDDPGTAAVCECLSADGSGAGVEEHCTFEGTDCGLWYACTADGGAQSCTDADQPAINAEVEQCVAELFASGGPGRFTTETRTEAGQYKTATTVIVLEDGTNLAWTEYDEDLSGGVGSATLRNAPDPAEIERCTGLDTGVIDCIVAAVEAVEPEQLCTEPQTWTYA